MVAERTSEYQKWQGAWGVAIQRVAVNCVVIFGFLIPTIFSWRSENISVSAKEASTTTIHREILFRFCPDIMSNDVRNIPVGNPNNV